MVTLIKEIGSDAAFALLRVLEGEELDRARAFYERCRADDLAVAVAQTDVKGHRARAPHEQDDPDLYVRVVDQGPDGIVVRGPSATRRCAPTPTSSWCCHRAMGEPDADYAVAFAVPTDAPGLSMYISAYSAGNETLRVPSRRGTRCSRP